MRELVLQFLRAVAGRRQRDKAEVPQYAAKPPRHERRALPAQRKREQPRAVVHRRDGGELVQHGGLKPVGEKALAFQPAKKFLHHAALGDDHHHRLQAFRRVVTLGRRGVRADNVHRPDDLRDRQRRKLFQLQLDHRERLLEVARRQLDDAQEDIFRGQPGDIQLWLPKRRPVFGDALGRQFIRMSHA